METLTQVTPTALPAVTDSRDAMLQAWSAELAARVNAGELSANSRATYANAAARYAAWLRETGANPTLPATVRDFKAAMLARGHKPASVNVWLSGVRAFYAWAQESGQTQANPAASVKGVRRPGANKVHKRDRLTDAEVRRLLALPLPARDKALLALKLYTGIRDVEAHRADLASLQTRNGAKVLVIQGKGHVEADDFVKVSAACEDMLAPWLAERGPQAGPLFTSDSDRSRGERLSLRSMREIVKAAYAQAGITEPNKTSHSTRHTAITKAVEKAGLIAAQQMARHASVDTTRIYWHESNRLANAAEDLIDYGEGDK